jgi:hypothetical protein
MKSGLIKYSWDTRVCKSVRSTFAALALFFWLGSSVWAGDVVNVYHGSLVGAATQALTTVLHEDFEDDALGPLGAPWTISSAGSSSVSIVNTTDHGHALRLQGSSAEGHFLIASRALSSSSREINTQVDIKPSSGASFIWILNGAGSSIGRRRIRLQQAPGTTTLVASTVPSGNTNCGTLRSGAWSRVTLIVHSVPRTFDVLINGAPTACTGVAADIQPPFNSVSVMDASNAGWGGNVLFDNIDVTTP